MYTLYPGRNRSVGLKAKEEFVNGGYVSLHDKAFRIWAQKENNGFVGSPVMAKALDYNNSYADTHHL